MHTYLMQWHYDTIFIMRNRLSGMCPNKGYFSRIDKSHLEWNYRKDRLLNEIIQYDPDIITMQEVDHFYDFFLPELNERGGHIDFLLM